MELQLICFTFSAILKCCEYLITESLDRTISGYSIIECGNDPGTQKEEPQPRQLSQPIKVKATWKIYKKGSSLVFCRIKVKHRINYFQACKNLLITLE